MTLKIETPIDYISILIFIVLIIFWCDLDIQGYLLSTGINTNVELGLLLCGVILGGIAIYLNVSKITGVLIFVIILLLTKVLLSYTELFTTTTTFTPKISNGTTTTNPNLAPFSEFSGSVDEVQQFLLRQIADDPNTTTIDKRVMKDLTERYFKTSSKLAELRGFNIATETANMLPGQQIIVGLDTVKNQH